MARPKRSFWRAHPVEVIMGALAIMSLILLLWEIFGKLSPETIAKIAQFDVVVGLIFLVEFTLRWLASEDRMKYFKANWWLLLACIPVSGDLAVALRIVRLERVIRVARIAGHLSYGRVRG